MIFKGFAENESENGTNSLIFQARLSNHPALFPFLSLRHTERAIFHCLIEFGCFVPAD
jgi:hypothetical protein